MLSPDRISNSTVAHRSRRRLRRGAPRHRPYPRPLARTARNRRHRGSRRRDADRTASFVPPLGRAHAEGFPAGADARRRAAIAARFRERARRHLRSGTFRSRPPARSVRHPRSDVAGRMEIRRRRPDDPFRLSSVAVRHRAGHGHRARARRPGLCRSRRGKGGARRHEGALAEGALQSKTPRAPRRSRSAFSIRRNGGRSSRCAWC